MGTGKRDAKVNGVLIVDKPQGVTSHDIVAAVRAALHTRKVGHAGTLDPMATGALVIGVGHATRLLQYIVEHTKTYSATIRFGQRTTTDDADGEFVEREAEAAVLPTLEQVREAVANEYTGDIEQIPNAVSAIKVNGQRAYDLAREGRHVELKARRVTVHAFDVLGGRQTQAANGTPVLDVDVRVTCSAGTYIRALARDLGNDFHCGAHLTRLRREAVGAFRVRDARIVRAHAEARTFVNRDGEEITRNRAVLDCVGEDLAGHLLTMVQAAQLTLPVLAVSEAQAADLRFGRRIVAQAPTDDERPAHHHGEHVWAAIGSADGEPEVVAIVERAKHHEFKPVTVFAANTGNESRIYGYFSFDTSCGRQRRMADIEHIEEIGGHGGCVRRPACGPPCRHRGDGAPSQEARRILGGHHVRSTPGIRARLCKGTCRQRRAGRRA